MDSEKRSDNWGKLGFLLQSSSGLITAVAVAVLGFIGSNYLKDRENAETASRERMQASETNVRVYTELMSKREEAESALRKDMFVSMIQSFLKPGTASLDEKVLNLELLSYNFHESLNLKPLFAYLNRQIVASHDPAKQDYFNRLQKVSTETIRKQLLVLEGAGAKIDRLVDLDSLKASGGGIPLEDATLTLDGITRDFSILVQEASRATKELKLRLEIRMLKDSLGNYETNSAEFWIGFFDFPMIDNMRLSHDQRCSVVLNAFDDKSADITLAYFPGSYASLKEKPYYQEVIQNLMKMSSSPHQEQ